VTKKSKIQNRKWAGLFAVVFALTFGGAVATAQQPRKTPHVGLLYASAVGNSARIQAFREGLRELGYVEGKNVVIDYRYAEGKLDRYPVLAAELVRLNVDVIVTGGPAGTRPVKEATRTIPVVMAQDSNPVGNGFVISLAQPGGNITGLSTLAPEISGKQLEILKEILPKLSRVAVFGTESEPGASEQLQQVEAAATAFKVSLHYLNAKEPKDLDGLFRNARAGRADAALILGGAVFAAQRSQLADLAVIYRLPAIYFTRNFVDHGGLMTYGASITDLDRRAAVYVDKILKGARPADLPVEQPTKFEFVINLKTAKQIGLTIPPNVLARADKVIK
jgi:putative ABC transport system substrate-binding protein